MRVLSDQILLYTHGKDSRTHNLHNKLSRVCMLLCIHQGRAQQDKELLVYKHHSLRYSSRLSMLCIDLLLAQCNFHMSYDRVYSYPYCRRIRDCRHNQCHCRRSLDHRCGTSHLSSNTQSHKHILSHSTPDILGKFGICYQ